MSYLRRLAARRIAAGVLAWAEPRAATLAARYTGAEAGALRAAQGSADLVAMATHGECSQQEGWDITRPGYWQDVAAFGLL